MKKPLAMFVVTGLVIDSGLLLLDQALWKFTVLYTLLGCLTVIVGDTFGGGSGKHGLRRRRNHDIHLS